MQPGHNVTETSAIIWDAARMAPSGPTKRKGRTKKSDIICYPEFEEAAQTMDDSFWQDILQRCARRKFPRSFVYSDTFLHHRTSGTYIKLPDDPQALAQTAVYFFQENGKIFSKHDREMQRRQDEEKLLIKLAKSTSNWTAVSRSKKRRATHIRDYIERKYGHLPKRIRDELYTQINSGFETGFIKKENIVFKDGQLIDIDGFDANEDGVFPTRPLSFQRLTPIVREPQPKKKIYRHLEGWLKYLEDYRKYVILSAKSSCQVQASDCSEASQAILDTESEG